MRVWSGRGIREGSVALPWRYRIECDADSGVVKGVLAVEGWEESRFMADWAEARRTDSVRITLLGSGRTVELEIGIHGVRVHESGHYSETDVQIEGRMAGCP
jgi:hypothetical protein